MRRPADVDRRLRLGDLFIKEIVQEGKYCMKELVAEWLKKAEGDARIFFSKTQIIN